MTYFDCPIPGLKMTVVAGRGPGTYNRSVEEWPSRWPRPTTPVEPVVTGLHDLCRGDGSQRLRARQHLRRNPSFGTTPGTAAAACAHQADMGWPMDPERLTRHAGWTTPHTRTPCTARRMTGWDARASDYAALRARPRRARPGSDMVAMIAHGSTQRASIGPRWQGTPRPGLILICGVSNPLRPRAPGRQIELHLTATFSASCGIR